MFNIFSYGAPSASYGAPEESYGAPAPSYGSPGHSYSRSVSNPWADLHLGGEIDKIMSELMVEKKEIFTIFTSIEVKMLCHQITEFLG